MRERLNISDELLQECLQQNYGFPVVALDFLPIGLDTRAGVYRVLSEQGTAYFLKVKAGRLYEPACFIPRYLADCGIKSVVAPLPTRQDALWVELEEWSLCLYPFIEGDTIGWQVEPSAEIWKTLGENLKQIHQCPMPPADFPSVKKENFDYKQYSDWIDIFETQQIGLTSNNSSATRLWASWQANQPLIHLLLNSMEKLALILQTQSGPSVICHADLHPGNLMHSSSDEVFLIDWDDVMLAPKERDFLFIKEGKAVSQEAVPFFQGYGKTGIDWIALTYYCCERVIQDIIACATDVCLRDDLEEATKAEATQLFEDVLAEGGEVEAAFAAAAHLPSNLSFKRT